MDSSRIFWRIFEKSGKLTDYLTFCEQRRAHAVSPADDTETKRRVAEDQSSL